MTVPAQPFLSKPGDFSRIFLKRLVTDIDPDLQVKEAMNRIIQEYCPVVEFGLVGKTMHQTDENVEIKQIENLNIIYQKILKSYFDNFSTKNS